MSNATLVARGRLRRSAGYSRWQLRQSGYRCPELVANYGPKTVIFHSENGILGPTPNDNEIDWELINAGKNL